MIDSYREVISNALVVHGKLYIESEIKSPIEGSNDTWFRAIDHNNKEYILPFSWLKRYTKEC